MKELNPNVLGNVSPAIYGKHFVGTAGSRE